MSAYEPERWQDLYVAMAGAAAALAGLLFVAVSINLADILKSAALPRRALEALLIMLSVVLVSIFVLTPDQPAALLGAEIALVGGLFGFGLLVTRLRTARPPGYKLVWTAVPSLQLVLTFLPMVIGGISLAIETGGGLYWLVPSLAFGFVTAITSAWVLLVEILR